MECWERVKSTKIILEDNQSKLFPQFVSIVVYNGFNFALFVGKASIDQWSHVLVHENVRGFYVMIKVVDEFS